ncbi:heavy metal-associated isoprenylated plant protein 32 [Actinidia eriantha]|uniref:heavy metal-associated isoprenylated plant protein 32 n=1 Tax=Actinidia eriantha TaxID=165200 RepID=UPI00258A7025|nr:heavy metal-associated isoprenylated plant protein 32 [Actinidia eriantha]
MDSYANAGCVLKVDVNCETCKMKLYDVLRSISGPYSVTIDAEEGIAKISGEVDPNILLHALGSGGRHAELKWVNLKSPAPNRAYYDDGYSSYSYGYGHGHGHDDRAIKQPYCGRRWALPDYSYPNGSYSHYPYM